MHRPRPLNKQRLHGLSFSLAVIVIGTWVYQGYFPRTVGHLFWSRIDGTGQAGWSELAAQAVARPLLFASCVALQMLFLLLAMSFYNCSMTDPGVIPPYWGFYLGDETKRRRYCKLCNVWKPDRTHHCSVCNRCNLAMDHHCPWVMCCIGFYNRKFFIQLLVYVMTVLPVILGTMWPEVADRISWFGAGDAADRWNLFGTQYPRLAPVDAADGSAALGAADLGTVAWFYFDSVIVLTGFVWALLMFLALFNFSRFHLRLVLENRTTIENLEKEEGQSSKFDIGQRKNLEQVMGTQPWLWWLPMHTAASRPAGDGVRWRVHYTRVIDEDEELPGEDGRIARGRR